MRYVVFGVIKGLGVATLVGANVIGLVYGLKNCIEYLDD